MEERGKRERQTHRGATAAAFVACVCGNVLALIVFALIDLVLDVFSVTLVNRKSGAVTRTHPKHAPMINQIHEIIRFCFFNLQNEHYTEEPYCFAHFYCFLFRNESHTWISTQNQNRKKEDVIGCLNKFKLMEPLVLLYIYFHHDN